MRPDFALSLSLEGITLLRRKADGWEVVGETHLDAPDLAATLDNLRSDAVSSESEGLRCALIIPDDQIRYLRVAATEAGSDDEILEILENATPYSLDQLAYDTALSEGHVHMAAVAKGTLEEAEQFAIQHGFDPVCFVANPAEQDFPFSPLFGLPSSIPTGYEVEWNNETFNLVEPHADDADTSPDQTPGDIEDAEVEEDNSSPPITFVSRRTVADNQAVKPAAPDVAAEGTNLTDIVADTPQESVDPADVETKNPHEPEDAETATETPDQGEIADIAPTAPISEKSEPIPNVPVFETGTETERMTIFGAREQVSEGKWPHRTGYWIAAVLALVVFGAATWAMLSGEDGLAWRSDDRAPDPALALAPDMDAPDVQSRAPTLSDTTDPSQQSETVRLQPPTGTPADENLRIQPLDQTADGTSLDPQNGDINAATGFSQTSPVEPSPPAQDDLNALYEVSIDKTDLEQDAVALLDLSTLDTDQPLDAINAPAAAGTTFDLDENGLVIPTPEGAPTPEGITVFSGKPPVVPPAPPTRFEAEPEEDTAIDRLAGLRPKLRPTDLQEQAERAQLGGFTRDELGNVRPRLRPVAEKQTAEIDETPTAQAVAVSPAPKTRPRNFSTRVAQTREKQAGPSSQVSAAVVAPKTVTPRIPSSASVARRATLDNAINLRRVNLIGVFGTPSNRRALVRLPNGRYKKIKIGDRVDGGRVVAIGESELRYQKGGRNVTLKMPRG